MDINEANILIERAKDRRQKANLANQKYRNKLKDEAGSVEKYREQRRIAMREYREKQKIQLKEAYITATPSEEAQEDRREEIRTRIQDPRPKKSKFVRILKLNEISDTKKPTPIWYRIKPSTTKDDFIQMKRISDQNRIRKDLVIIKNIIRDLYGYELDNKYDALVRKIYKGEDLSKQDTDNFFSKDGFGFLDISKVETFATKLGERYKNLNSFKTNMNPFTNILSRAAFPSDSFGNNKKIIQKFYRPYAYASLSAIDAAQEYVEEREKNLANTNIFDFSIENIRDKIQSIDNLSKYSNPDSKGINSYEAKALAGVYTLHAPRRVNDYRLLRLEKVEAEDVLDTENNYLLIDNSFTPIKMIFHIYKTANKFKKQEIIINTELQNLLKNHILTNKLNTRDYVFGTRSSKYKSPKAGLGEVISNLFTAMFGQDLTLNNIRQSASTYFYQNKNRTVQEIKQFAESMSHAPLTSLQYRRFKTDDDAVQKFVQEEEKKIQVKSAERSVDTTNINMNERKSWVGKVLYKSFPGYRGKFRGTVSKYIKNRDVYAISYDDGDSEEMIYEDMKDYVEGNKK